MYATPEKLAFQLPEPRNGFPAGTTVTPSGCFSGYCVETVTMPTGYHAKQHWSKSAWASAEDGSESWLEIALPEERKGGKLLIDWNKDTPSRQFSIQVRSTPDDAWRNVDSICRKHVAGYQSLLPSESYRYIRIYQDENGGSERTPTLDVDYSSRVGRLTITDASKKETLMIRLGVIGMGRRRSAYDVAHEEDRFGG